MFFKGNWVVEMIESPFKETSEQRSEGGEITVQHHLVCQTYKNSRICGIMKLFE